MVCRIYAGVSSNKWPLFCEGSSNFIGTTMKLIITKIFRKKEANVLRSVKFRINELHHQIKRQMLSFLNINLQLLEASSQKFIFKCQLSLEGYATNLLKDYSKVCRKIDIETIREIISIISTPTRKTCVEFMKDLFGQGCGRQLCLRKFYLQ